MTRDFSQPINELKTPIDLMNAIPEEFRDAMICIGDSIGGANSIARVSLHRNDTGRLIVLLHDKPLQEK